MNLYKFTIYVDVCHLNDVYRDKDEFYLMIDHSWIFFSSCECPDGKFGVTCEEESSACTTGRHNCAEGC